MLIEFPYKVKPSKYIGAVFVVYVMLEVANREGDFEWHEFIFDTGADFTSLPKYMAEIGGVNLVKSPQEVMYTANNEPMVAFYNKIKIRLGGREFVLPCVFTDQDDTPFLLGRAGLIDKFTMILDGKKKKLVFKKI